MVRGLPPRGPGGILLLQHMHRAAWQFGLLALIVMSQITGEREAGAGPARPAPSLPAPVGAVVSVRTEAELQSAIQAIASDTTILISPGTYRLTRSLYINRAVRNITIRGGSDNADDTALIGPGMTQANYGDVPYGIWTGGGVTGITIANLTIRDFYFHDVIFNAGTQAPHVYNVHLIDSGQQFIKSNPDAAGVGASNGIVEYSTFEFTTTARDDYPKGVDIHGADSWIIRNNLFRNLVAPSGQLMGPAVLAWRGSSRTLVEGNTFLNCARGIYFGGEDSPTTSHTAGIIRNNFIFRSSSQPGDVGIHVADSPDTQVLNNTVVLSGTYSMPIEYRFTGSTGVIITNNLTDGAIAARDGATGSVTNNVTSAVASMFVDPGSGNLHLNASAMAAIDRGAPLAQVTTDWDGELRPQGPASDVGADEFGATAQAFSISGRVTDSSTGGGLAGVAMSLSGSRSATAVTDGAGVYRFTSLPAGGDFDVTPSLASYVFQPTLLSYRSLAGNETAAGFVGTRQVAPPPPPPPTNAAPTVWLTAPANGSTLTSGKITVSAVAADADGTVTAVRFYDGSTLIDTDSRTPYAITWRAAVGAHTLTAVAVDNSGQTTTSAPVSVTVVRR